MLSPSGGTISHSPRGLLLLHTPSSACICLSVVVVFMAVIMVVKGCLIVVLFCSRTRTGSGATQSSYLETVEVPGFLSSFLRGLDVSASVRSRAPTVNTGLWPPFGLFARFLLAFMQQFSSVIRVC